MTNDLQAALHRFSQALQFATVSYDDATLNDTALYTQFRAFLRENYPLMHSKLRCFEVEKHSLLFVWEGKIPFVPPVLLAAHYDVVPVQEQTIAQWTHPPFSGAIADGFVWGRGAMDDKIGLIGIAEAVESMLAAGFQPERSLYFAFGHDEEVGGGQGARKIALHLKQLGKRFSFVLDEGLFMLTGAFPGIERPVAYIAVGEKGFVNVRLKVKADGGHAASPNKETAVSILAKAITRLQDHPPAPRWHEALEEMLSGLAPYLPHPKRLLFANSQRFKKIILNGMGGKPTTNAASRTTIAPTMLQGSDKSNILPTEASAVLNCRIIPGETVEDVFAHIQKTIADTRVSVEQLPGTLSQNPVRLSSSSSDGYRLISASVNQIFPEAIPVPGLMVASTDSRHYADIADDIYRFLPVQLENDDLKRFHGIDERLSEENFRRAILFYKDVIGKL